VRLGGGRCCAEKKEKKGRVNDVFAKRRTRDAPEKGRKDLRRWRLRRSEGGGLTRAFNSVETAFQGGGGEEVFSQNASSGGEKGGKLCRFFQFKRDVPLQKKGREIVVGRSISAIGQSLTEGKKRRH